LVVESGFLADKTYPTGEKVALIAALNEWGAPSHGQPPRPFFRNMIAKNSPQWSDQVRKVLAATDYDVRLTLERMGFLLDRQLVESIDALTSPPLAPATIARKGFDKPLVDSGVMRNSVSHRVTEGT